MQRCEPKTEIHIDNLFVSITEAGLLLQQRLDICPSFKELQNIYNTDVIGCLENNLGNIFFKQMLLVLLLLLFGVSSCIFTFEKLCTKIIIQKVAFYINTIFRQTPKTSRML